MAKVDGVCRSPVPSSELGVLNITPPKLASLEHTEIAFQL